MHFDIGEASEASGQSAKEAVIEATIPQEVFPLDMKMSGTRIFSLEELCWYLSKNVYITTYDLFDEKCFSGWIRLQAAILWRWHYLITNPPANH